MVSKKSRTRKKQERSNVDGEAAPTANNRKPLNLDEKNGTHKIDEKKLTESTVMAPNFVPDAIRRILFVPVTGYHFARPLPNMMDHANQTYEASVPRPPQCNCQRLHPVGFPSREMAVVPVDPYFAIRQETKRRLSPDFSLDFPRLENAKRKDDYLNILQSLLKEEFEERMMLYERYTQYEAKLQLNPNATRQATMEIPGIHNARPALEPGDNVLLRPQPKANQGGGQSLKATPEIHCQVILTVRGNWNRKKRKMAPDKVVITWLDPKDEKVLDKNRQFAVRFLPSTTNLQRSFTALQWVRALDPQVARELLFPTETPQIPFHYVPKDQFDQDLNEKQSRFVSMVLTRTRHPCMDKVRPPMILTGPAGTGKTKTLLASILKVLADKTDGDHNQKRILVCTPSHTACDVICRRLSQSMSPQRLFRMYPSEVSSFCQSIKSANVPKH